MGTRWIPLLLALAWGLNWPVMKILLGSVPPFALRTLGLGLGGLLLLLVAAARGTPLRPAPGGWGFVLLGGVCTIGGFSVCVSLAQLSTSTARAAVLTFSFPLVSALLAWWFLGERLDRRSRWALLLGGAGVGVLAWPVLGPALALGSGPAAPRAWAGLLLPLGAALCWAVGTVATKRWPPVGDRVVLVAWQLLVAAACTAVLSAVLGEPWPRHWPWSLRGALLFHVVLATALAYLMWYRLLAAQGATVASLTTLAVPVVGVLGAMALVGDRPSALDWLGFAAVLAGAALAVLNVGPVQAATPRPRV